MRHFKLKVQIIWAIITDNYTNCNKKKCWWLWSDDHISISFGKQIYARDIIVDVAQQWKDDPTTGNELRLREALKQLEKSHVK